MQVTGWWEVWAISDGKPAPGLMRVIGRAGPAVLLLMLLGGCAVGGRHTPDSNLERNFLQHQSQFEALLADLQADGRIKMMGIGELRYADGPLSTQIGLANVDRLGLPKERWIRYQKQLQDLGIVMAFQGSGGVALKVDSESLLNGDSSKGYEYTEVPPEHLKRSLDGYRLSQNDRDISGNYSVAKQIKGHWYIYLDVTR